MWGSERPRSNVPTYCRSHIAGSHASVMRPCKGSGPPPAEPRGSAGSDKRGDGPAGVLRYGPKLTITDGHNQECIITDDSPPAPPAEMVRRRACDQGGRETTNVVGRCPEPAHGASRCCDMHILRVYMNPSLLPTNVRKAMRTSPQYTATTRYTSTKTERFEPVNLQLTW